MYHYVRELEHSRYPRIKALTAERFRNQIAYIVAHYNPVSVDDLFEAVISPTYSLPPNAILLTFDDGYSDHFDHVLPILRENGMKACFFPPAEAVLEHKVLDVNKIQFVLATTESVQSLLNELFQELDTFRGEYDLKARDEYVASITEKHRFDPPEVIAFKRLLQRELPETIRTEIVRRLFARHVTSDEAAFACELYMSIEQLRQLAAEGMHIGSHGFAHAWLNHLDPEAQRSEIDRSLDFLRQIGISLERWTMCYPYGGFDSSLLKLLREKQCKLGFTVEPRIAELGRDHELTLPRIDTNDLPS